MKKKLLLTLLLITTISFFSSCGTANKGDGVIATEVENTEKVGTDSSDKSVPDEINADILNAEEAKLLEPEDTDSLVSVYAPLLKDLINMVYLGAEPMHEELYSMQGEVMYMNEESRNQIGFCFYDLDGDEKKEIIIGKDDTIYALGSYCGSGPYILLGAGYRTMLSIFEDNSLLLEGSSGASCYSYTFYDYDGVFVDVKDFYYTDYDDQSESIVCFHNTTGDWNDLPEDIISEDEYNICTDVGLEKKNFSHMYIPIGEYKDSLCGIDSDFGIENLCLPGVTWSLTEYETIDDKHVIQNDEIIQTLNFNEDGSAVFYRNDENGEIKAEDITPITDNMGFSYIYLGLTMPDTTYQSIYILGFLQNGTLVTQRSYYDIETGNSHLLYEYYVVTLG